MARQIKFRAWHSSQKKMFSCKEMTQDQMTLLPDGRFINVSGQSHSHSIIFDSDKMVPLQFTGRKDKNGKEIYEGDIWQRDSFIGEIVFKFSRWDMVMLPQSGCQSYPSFYSSAKDGEVIGNIYENPPSGHEETVEAKDGNENEE